MYDDRSRRFATNVHHIQISEPPRKARASMRTETYDYVICGAGSAGCVLANRLSADPGVRVLVLEAGPMDRDLMIHIPAGVYAVYTDPRINWNYQTEDEPELNGRNVYTPRGKVVGGSSSINSMVYMRGHPRDYDRWGSEFGLGNWTYDRCLPYFKAGEASDRGASDWRGADGPLGVTKGDLQNPLFDAFLDAGEQAGQGRSDDLNGYRPEGVARLDSTKKNGRRCSAAVAHLRPAMKRKNLYLETRAMARRIVIERNRASGVEYQRHGEVRTARAEREVILSGGAINSPQLMMISGIGPADHLRSVGIEPKLDLPGVGRSLQDHPKVAVQAACTEPVTIDWVAKPTASSWPAPGGCCRARGSRRRTSGRRAAWCSETATSRIRTSSTISAPWDFPTRATRSGCISRSPSTSINCARRVGGGSTSSRRIRSTSPPPFQLSRDRA